MTETSPILDLPYLQPSQAQKHVTHNEALARLDAVTQLTVAALGLAAPPADPVAGDRYLIGAGAEGSWSGHDGEIAVFQDGYWEFLAPKPGWSVLLRDTGAMAWFDGGDWVPVRSETAQTLGVNAQADTVNRLTVSAPATLLSHEGAGHRVVVNKAGAGETASLLFQSGWSGRAELGLSGEDALSIKVSPNGAEWQTALRFEPDGAAVSGGAVQQDGSDAAPGRLMLAEHGVLRSGILGAVAMAGGVPAGAILESGGTAQGRYIKWADGTMLCLRTVTVDLDSAAPQLFDYPVPVETPLGVHSGGADAAEATDALKRRASGALPVWATATGWHVQLEAPVTAATLEVSLVLIGLWI